MYSFSFVLASRYALQHLLPRLSCCLIWIEILLALGTLLRLLQSRCCLLDQEVDDHLLLVLLYGIHCVCMQKPDAH